MKTPEELAERVRALRDTLNAEYFPKDKNTRQDDENPDADSDVIDRSGHAHYGHFILSDYYDSFFENLDQIRYMLDKGANEDGSAIDYKDAQKRLCGSMYNLGEKSNEEEGIKFNLSDDDTFDTYMALETIVKNHDRDFYGTVDLDEFESSCDVQPALVKVALDYPENFHAGTLVEAFTANEKFYAAAAGSINDKQRGIHISRNRNHVFYFNPQYKQDIRYCGCAVKEERFEKQGRIEKPYYYTPLWHGDERSLTVSFISDANERRPVRYPDGRRGKYLFSPQYEEQYGWLFDFYATVNDVFGTQGMGKPQSVPRALHGNRYDPYL